MLILCMITVCCFMSVLSIFHSHQDATIADEGPHNSDLHVHMAMIKYGGNNCCEKGLSFCGLIQRPPHLVTAYEKQKTHCTFCGDTVVILYLIFLSHNFQAIY
jgi:hypothetical protein